jgi:DNA-damage-inducible protein J
MARNSYISVRADEKVKKEAEFILNKLGLSPSDAINLFYRQVALQKGLPFDVKIPNEETISAIDNLENGVDVEIYEADDYLKMLKNMANKAKVSENTPGKKVQKRPK